MCSAILTQGLYGVDAADAPEEKLNFIFSDRWLAHHALVLDAALDLLAADRLEAARRAGSYYGFGFCTDESPPAAPRYRGLRFQITNMFIPMFVPVERWEDADYNEK